MRRSTILKTSALAVAALLLGTSFATDYKSDYIRELHSLEATADTDYSSTSEFNLEKARNDLDVLTSISLITTPVSAPLKFSRACDAGKQFTLVAVGDVLLHEPLAIQGMRDGFGTLWSPLEKYFRDGDFAYANLEGPTAGNVSAAGKIVPDPGRRFDGVAYTGYPQFNYHPSLGSDLKASGFDIVSTANNHAMDRRSIGVDRTIEALRAADLQFSGTTASSELYHREYSTRTKERGLTIAWIACTFSTNGIPDAKNQVLSCFDERATLLSEIRRQKADPSVDAVIVTPHWGIEYNIFAGADQKKLAREMIEAGALIVFGSHPHVLQPVEKIVASDGREGFVIYSLGNFVSNQKLKLATKTAAVVFVGLTRDSNGKVFINGVRHLPTTMMFDSTISVRPAKGNLEESRTLANQILTGSTELLPSESVVTNPQCD